jgi:predicted nucleotidyltransferase
MRLSEFELRCIRETLLEADPSGKIYLFGSRIDDTGKGGDIDIFFESSRAFDPRAALTLEYRLI